MAPRWDVIKSEYIGGGISQRKLAEKYGVNADVLMQRANREHWKQERDKAISRASARTQQKVAEAISSNAAIAQRIKTKLLRKLEKEIDALPDRVGSGAENSIVEYGKDKTGNKVRKSATQMYSLRDLSVAYKNLTEDMNLTDSSEPVRIIIDV